ncbi:MAG: threonine synthase [Deltaproteobacteria bacterium]|nr:MAG: threonine synthase [Deltaproteobacteria bacterium]
MSVLSTRDPSCTASLSEAIRTGLAPDGGLYVPRELPRVELSTFAGAHEIGPIAARALRPYFAGDALAEEISQIALSALSFPAPLRPLPTQASASMLELFHGPTAAFKDFGARFLASCLEAGDERDPPTILVATSGDTGSAVAAAFHERSRARVLVLYPAGAVSARQEHQLTCWQGNITALRVLGTFDDCQRLVKQAFVDPELRAGWRLSSANSINLGRLLPQVAYYASSSLAIHRAEGRPASYIIPSGNLGNAVACVWARSMGLPIERIVLAHNANRGVPDLLRTGTWTPRPSVATLASAMDVAHPSNLERLRHLARSLCGAPSLEVATLRSLVEAHSVTDAQIRATIRRGDKEWGVVFCPHTATAAHVYRELPRAEREGRHWVLVATAHPAKFEQLVEPLIGRAVAVPPALAELLERPTQARTVPADLAALARELEG